MRLRFHYDPPGLRLPDYDPEKMGDYTDFLDMKAPFHSWDDSYVDCTGQSTEHLRWLQTKRRNFVFRSAKDQRSRGQSSTNPSGFWISRWCHIDYTPGFCISRRLGPTQGTAAVPSPGGRSIITPGKDSTKEPKSSRIHRVSTSSRESGASAGTHGYMDNTRIQEWRSGSHSTAYYETVITINTSRYFHCENYRKTTNSRYFSRDSWLFV